MKQLGGLSFIVVTVLLLLVAIWYYLFSRVIATTKDSSTTSSSDNNRVHTVNDLATKISFLASQQQDSGVIFPQSWQQLGTAGTECELATPHCQITLPGCFNLEGLGKNKFTIPFDSVYGTSERTGFAIKQEGDMIHIRACFSDDAAPIAQKIRLP